MGKHNQTPRVEKHIKILMGFNCSVSCVQNDRDSAVSRAVLDAVAVECLSTVRYRRNQKSSNLSLNFLWSGKSAYEGHGWKM